MGWTLENADSKTQLMTAFLANTHVSKEEMIIGYPGSALRCCYTVYVDCGLLLHNAQ